jgi:hypothetical protein
MAVPKRKNTKHKKISETFREFASPSLEIMGVSPEDPEGETLLKVCWTVWNAVILADFGGRTDLLDKLLDPSLSSPASVVLVKTLIERKRSRRFADDNLLIGDYKLKNVDGELRLWAEARQTPTPKGQ